MKSLALLKQRALYGGAEESAEFKALKDQVIGFRHDLLQASTLMKGWIEGIRALQRTWREMAELLGSNDSDFAQVAGRVAETMADTASGAGLAEVALDSVNQKLGLINDLKKKSDRLHTLHLELSRFERKLKDTHDPAKQKSLQPDRDRASQAYESLQQELLSNFRFVIAEAGANTQQQTVSGMGLISPELKAFKASQRQYFSVCDQATLHFPDNSDVHMNQIWESFMERLNQNSANMTASSGSLSQSGRNLFQQGIGMPSSQTSNISSAVPPPPPPPPPPPSQNTYRALYDYDAADSDEMSIRTGMQVTVLNQDDAGWWKATDGFNSGMIPANYLEKV